ncbi:GNAT family N-acetyltransferase [Actinoplanes friuliensis]|uniref:GCN5-like N-acetyltransferase n=1 Tax=Actinoplanes friuliensis DSM 7358 TaxID=1246995 RepID=U5W4I7_9ACTN|nr:GNAT family N-acetyltransferase [Actinoplanes friuliensis]AGZ43927.1 GCN5-like N-acetyltransferase [Actinoplanes friuliensis DSM 7358]
MPEISVRAMTPAEFDHWNESTVHELAAVNVAAGNWPADEAVDRARQSRLERLPDGVDTADMLFLLGLRPDSTPIGFLWIGLKHPRGVQDCAFLYFIEVTEAHRGSGYGRALLQAGEQAVRARGLSSLELNVFGANTRAVHLYETAGYTVVTQQMRKPL